MCVLSSQKWKLLEEMFRIMSVHSKIKYKTHPLQWQQRCICTYEYEISIKYYSCRNADCKMCIIPPVKANRHNIIESMSKKILEMHTTKIYISYSIPNDAKSGIFLNAFQCFEC